MIKVLLLAADPFAISRLRLDEELRQIRTKLRGSDHRGAIEVVPWSATRPDDLVQGLLEHRPHVVHFSGHGSSINELIFIGEDGNPQPVGATALRHVFGALRDNVRLVLFNACYSDVQAAAIADHVDFTIGMTGMVGDAAAVVFAASFYRALGFGRSVQESFELGKVALMLQGTPEHDTPTLVARPGAPDPAYLMSPDPRGESHPTVIVSGHVDRNPAEPDSTLRYEERLDGDRIRIEPREPYLDLLRAGGELTPLNFWHSPWEYRFRWPTFDVKVVNNTDRTVMFHRAVLQVGSSRPDLRAVPLLRGKAYGTYLPLVNAGWGPMTDCVFRFRIFSGKGDTDAVTPELEWRFGTVDKAGDEDALRGFFAKAGIDFDALDRLRYSGSDGWSYYLPASSGLGELVPTGGDQLNSLFAGQRRLQRAEYESLRLRALGPFENRYAVLRGTLSYTHIGLDGTPTEATNPIVSYVMFDEPGAGAPMPPSYTYEVKLRTEGTDYEVAVPVSQAIRPGDTDRFAFTVAADKSSLHDLKLLLLYNEGASVESAAISLELFASRYDVDQ